MGSRMDKTKTGVLDWLMFWLLFLVVFVAWSLLLAIPSPPLGRGSSSQEPEAVASLPDLSRCTRLETWYVPSTYTVFTDNGRYASLMSAEELEELRSHEKGVLEDAGLIAKATVEIDRMYAQDSRESHSSYVPVMACVAAYEGAERTAAIRLMAQDHRMIRGSWWIDYGDRRLIALGFAPDLKPLALRLRCASVIESLGRAVRNCPTPNTWADAVVEEPTELFDALTAVYGEKLARDMRGSCLQCPSAAPGRCHYAMNANCQPDSPGDMVLLFETKAGWNQHGGPELFTFDNHDPKGGCVLLNDGAVKFIRTEAELHALRWK